jgi:hypothetical protein
MNLLVKGDAVDTANVIVLMLLTNELSLAAATIYLFPFPTHWKETLAAILLGLIGLLIALWP